MCLFPDNCESSIVCVDFVEKEMVEVCEFCMADKRINISSWLSIGMFKIKQLNIIKTNKIEINNDPLAGIYSRALLFYRQYLKQRK